MRVGLFLKYDREIGKWSENREIPDLWWRVDRYACTLTEIRYFLVINLGTALGIEKLQKSHN